MIDREFLLNESSRIIFSTMILFFAALIISYPDTRNTETNRSAKATLQSTPTSKIKKNMKTPVKKIKSGYWNEAE